MEDNPQKLEQKDNNMEMEMKSRCSVLERQCTTNKRSRKK